MKRATVRIGLVQWDAESVLAYGSEEDFVKMFMEHQNYETLEPKERRATLKAVWKECKRVYQPPKDDVEEPKKKSK